MKTGSELLFKCYQNKYQNNHITEEDLTTMVQKNQITELEKQEIISGGSTQPDTEKQEIISGGSTQPDTEKEELNEFYTSVIKEVGIE